MSHLVFCPENVRHVYIITINLITVVCVLPGISAVLVLPLDLKMLKSLKTGYILSKILLSLLILQHGFYGSLMLQPIGLYLLFVFFTTLTYVSVKMSKQNISVNVSVIAVGFTFNEIRAYLDSERDDRVFAPTSSKMEHLDLH